MSGTARDLTLSFAYNPASQIASTTRSNDAYAWTGHGSGTTSTTSNGLNQIAGWVNTLGYDSKGNVTSHGTYGYAYSSENLLTSMTNSAGGAAQPTIAFAYDPLMRLAVIDSSNSGFDANLGYDGQQIVYETLSGSRTRRYVFGPGTNEPLTAYLIQSSGTLRSWYNADERGSIIGQTDDSGSPAGPGGAAFDEYGVGAGSSRFHYTGQYWLGDHFHYYRARIYDPRLGRFLQPDPIGYGSGMNLYAYVGGDPINLSDPSGFGDEGIGLEEQTIFVTGPGKPVGGNGGTYPDKGCGVGAGSNPICNPARGLDDFMYRWWLTGMLDQWKVRYDLRYEPTFYVYEGLEVEEAKIEVIKVISCTNGVAADQNTLLPPDPGRILIAVGH